MLVMKKCLISFEAYKLKPPRTRLRAGVLGLALAITPGGVAAVQSRIAAPDGAPPSANAEAAPAGARLEVTVTAARAASLIKSTIIAIQQANETGNYSVLRDLGTPAFQERFDQSRLAAIFANLRNLNLDLSPVLNVGLNICEKSELDAANQLHLGGRIAAQQLQVDYELLFVMVRGAWRIQGLAIDTVAVKSAPGASSSAGEARLASGRS